MHSIYLQAHLRPAYVYCGLSMLAHAMHAEATTCRMLARHAGTQQLQQRAAERKQGKHGTRQMQQLHNLKMTLTLKTSSSLRTYSALIWGGSISLALGSPRTCSTHLQLAMAEDTLHKRHPQDHTNVLRDHTDILKRDTNASEVSTGSSRRLTWPGSVMPNSSWLRCVSLALQWPFMPLLALRLIEVSELHDEGLLIVLLVLSKSCSDVLLLLLSVALC